MDLDSAKAAVRERVLRQRRMDELAALDDIRTLIGKPEHHTVATYARDKLGRPCNAESPYAVAWCLSGAVSRLSNGRLDEHPRVAAAWLRLERAAKELGFAHVHLLNDTRGHRGALEAIDLAKTY